jgi:16S rRNA (uracil1498-N3)-methyltransferase
LTVTIRLFVDRDLGPDRRLVLTEGQAHYLQHVMRLSAGDELAVFNGRHGEWGARIEAVRKGAGTLALTECRRPQAAGSDVWLVFAPVKRTPIDLVAAKATELGASALRPVVTRHTAVARVNVERLKANAIEAAEQCGRLDVPAVHAPEPLESLLARWPPERRLMLCDESGAAEPVALALSLPAAREPWAILVGPEGGFAATELDAIRKLPFVKAVSLGPRLLRADTAAIAALACWQALAGDWRHTDAATEGVGVVMEEWPRV